MTASGEHPSSTQAADPPLPMFGMEDDNIPKNIGKFKILDLVAKSMALVYKAEQDDPSRIIALKIPRGGKLLSREAKDRFVREIGLTAGIDHSGIVPVLEAGEIDGMPYYTMPFIEGESLDSYLRSAGLDLASRLDLFLRICDVVQALHARDLVHRDLKPDNIMIDEHNDVRLLDFGLARACDESGPALTMDNSLLGTLQFMAPEQADPGGARNLTPATDVYSLGMILYFMLVKDYPYSVKGPRESVLQNIREATPKPPSTHDASVSEELDEIVLSALAKKPGRRPSTAGRLATALRGATVGSKEVQTAGRGRRPLLVLVMLCLVLLATAGLWARRRFRGAGAPVPELNPEVTSPKDPQPLVPQPETVTPDETPPTPKPDNDVVEAPATTAPEDILPAGISEGKPEDVIPDEPAPEPVPEPIPEPAPEPGTQAPSPPPAHVTQVRIEVVDYASIKGQISGQAPSRGENPIPVELWPLHDRAKSALTEEFRHRRDGAVLVRATSTAQSSSSSAMLSWQFEGESESRQKAVPLNGVAMMFLPARRQCHIELRSQEGVIRRTITVEHGAVRYLEM